MYDVGIELLMDSKYKYIFNAAFVLHNIISVY